MTHSLTTWRLGREELAQFSRTGPVLLSKTYTSSKEVSLWTPFWVSSSVQTDQRVHQKHFRAPALHNQPLEKSHEATALRMNGMFPKSLKTAGEQLLDSTGNLCRNLRRCFKCFPLVPVSKAHPAKKTRNLQSMGTKHVLQNPSDKHYCFFCFWSVPHPER